MNVWLSVHGCDGVLPVLFWFHGGACAFGFSARPDFDGAGLARGGLVVVGCDDWVGLEGFGEVPGFFGNRGLVEQGAVLGWVLGGSEACGGDLGIVTVAGRSFGAGSVACLMGVPQIKGLVGRAVVRSVSHAFCVVGLAAGGAGRIAAEAGVVPAAQGLLSVPPQARVAACGEVAAGAGPSLWWRFMPMTW